MSVPLLITPVILFITSPSDWIMILLVVLLLFGGKKIPELMRGLGQGVREFNAAKANIKSEIEEGMKQPSQPVQVPPTQTQTTTTTTENK